MTVFPAPVARLIPNRRLPSEIAVRQASIHSSWYGRRGRGEDGDKAEGGINRVMSLIFGGFLGLTGFVVEGTSEVAAGVSLACASLVPSSCTFFGRPRLRGAGRSADEFSSRRIRAVWNCRTAHIRGLCSVSCGLTTETNVLCICNARILRRGHEELLPFEEV